MAFRRLWHAIEVPHAPSSATQSHGRPSARASTKFLRGVGWLPPRHDGASPPMTTTCATSVLGVGGWTLAPSAAHPRVGSTRVQFTWGLCSAVPGCAAHYHTLGAAPEPQHTPYVRAERAWADRTAYILHPRIPHRVTRLSRERSLHAPHDAPWAPHSTPQARRVRARGACRVRPGPLHGPWRLPTITGTPRSPLF